RRRCGARPLALGAARRPRPRAPARRPPRPERRREGARGGRDAGAPGRAGIRLRGRRRRCARRSRRRPTARRLRARRGRRRDEPCLVRLGAGGGVTAAWYAARAGGLLAFALLTASVVLGLTLSGRARLRRWPRFAVEDVHRFAGVLVGAFVGIHVLALLVDT